MKLGHLKNSRNSVLEYVYLFSYSFHTARSQVISNNYILYWIDILQRHDNTHSLQQNSTCRDLSSAHPAILLVIVHGLRLHKNGLTSILYI